VKAWAPKTTKAVSIGEAIGTRDASVLPRSGSIVADFDIGIPSITRG
jgi:hypothetical protein